MVSRYSRFFYAENIRTSRPSARTVVPVLMELACPQAVVDIGCGLGTWLAEFKKVGVSDVQGVDGAYVDRDMLLIEPGEFLAHDLRERLCLWREYDLALCLEVAEHFAEEQSAGLIEALTRLAPVVLFSAAIPGQGGTGHVNEQWPDYWVSRFAEHGYRALDCLRERFWNDSAVEYWYAQNMFLFVRDDKLQADERLGKALRESRPGAAALVHPRAWINATDPRNWDFKKALMALPYAFKVGVTRRVQDVWTRVFHRRYKGV